MKIASSCDTVSDSDFFCNTQQILTERRLEILNKDSFWNPRIESDSNANSIDGMEEFKDIVVHGKEQI